MLNVCYLKCLQTCFCLFHDKWVDYPWLIRKSSKKKKKTTTKSNYGCRNFLFLERTSYDKSKDFLSLLCTKNITFTSNRTCTITRTLANAKQNPFPRANAKRSDQCFTKCKAKTTHQQSLLVLVQQATLSAARLGFWANKKENPFSQKKSTSY